MKLKNQNKTKEQLLAELAAMRQQVATLQESEERYRTLVEMVPQLMGWADANRETIEWNRRWYDYTGQTPEEARGLGWMKALHPDDVSRVAAADKRDSGYRRALRSRVPGAAGVGWRIPLASGKVHADEGQGRQGHRLVRQRHRHR